MSPEHAGDPGLQSERTALAWRRTAFALAIGSLVAFRVLAGSVGVFALVPSAVGLAVAGAILLSSHGRYHHHRRVVSASYADPDRIPEIAEAASAADILPGAAVIALTAAATALFGVAGLAYALFS
ncbi:DUF202 domain-containing protein [Agreia sp. COWG]|uniref:DUF202 domain-containing protein n=1 Tax=Agreia sp. COWG TaxID=2773266 RepID=UPI001928B275|nr:DUF202 domain-containing protein [Agreia sp. COWG]CAD5990057.1 conserved protein of unknown function [Agreia sp. COWG]